MSYILFVEGEDDERLLKKFFPGDQEKFIQYRTKSPKIIKKYLRGLKQSKLDYLFFADADGLSIDERKNKTANIYKGCEKEKISVVQYEIESWYLAGINQNDAYELKLKYIRSTDDIRKEQFNNMIPNKFKGDRIDFMIEIIKRFDNDEAISRNKSFRLFFEKHKTKLK